MSRKLDEKTAEQQKQARDDFKEMEARLKFLTVSNNLRDAEEKYYGANNLLRATVTREIDKFLIALQTITGHKITEEIRMDSIKYLAANEQEIMAEVEKHYEELRAKQQEKMAQLQKDSQQLAEQQTEKKDNVIDFKLAQNDKAETKVPDTV